MQLEEANLHHLSPWHWELPDAMTCAQGVSGKLNLTLRRLISVLGQSHLGTLHFTAWWCLITHNQNYWMLNSGNWNIRKTHVQKSLNSSQFIRRFYLYSTVVRNCPLLSSKFAFIAVNYSLYTHCKKRKQYHLVLRHCEVHHISPCPFTMACIFNLQKPLIHNSTTEWHHRALDEEVENVDLQIKCYAQVLESQKLTNI